MFTAQKIAMVWLWHRMQQCLQNCPWSEACRSWNRRTISYKPLPILNRRLTLMPSNSARLNLTCNWQARFYETDILLKCEAAAKKADSAGKEWCMWTGNIFILSRSDPVPVIQKLVWDIGSETYSARHHPICRVDCQYQKWQYVDHKHIDKMVEKWNRMAWRHLQVSMTNTLNSLMNTWSWWNAEIFHFWG